MARELKIGIAVIGLLLVVFCGLLAKRLIRPTKMPLTSIAASGNAKPDSKATKPAVKPTVIAPQVEPVKPQDGYWTGTPGQTNGNTSRQTQTQDRYAGQDYPQSPTDKSNDLANST